MNTNPGRPNRDRIHWGMRLGRGEAYEENTTIMKTAATSFALSLLAFLAPFDCVWGQTVTATAGSQSVGLASNPAMVTFVLTNATTAEGAIKSAAISAAQGQAVAATLVRAVPIPVVGPLAQPLMGVMMKRLQHPKPVTGFSVAFLNGLYASTVLPAGEVSFTIPTEALQGASPSLLRLKPSAKDSTRIVRSIHVSIKATGGAVSTDTKDAQVLGVDQDVIPTSTQNRNGALVMTPNSPLEAGQYAIALVPASQQAMVPVGHVWDFRIDGQPVVTSAAPAPSEPLTISMGQNSSQVVSSLGQPEKISKDGVRETYYYKDMRVMFVNGKVTDFQ